MLDIILIGKMLVDEEGEWKGGGGVVEREERGWVGGRG